MGLESRNESLVVPAAKLISKRDWTNLHYYQKLINVCFTASSSAMSVCFNYNLCHVGRLK